MSFRFDVIVIGSGHAAVEAALAPARMGLRTCMLTLDKTKIGQMSCNPAVGGIAKGQVVREVDALGGEMGRVTDRAGMQFRMLNRGRGPAVWSPRAQCDRALYRDEMTATVLNTPNLTVVEDEAVEILVDHNRVAGVMGRNGVRYESRAVVLGTGTFLKGLLHCGLDASPGGRIGEPPAAFLSDSLRALGFEVGRLKTGTPMRLDGRTIDYSKCEIQPGDANPIPFSFRTRSLSQKQIPCWLTHTNPAVHDIIRNNLDRSPIYSGKISTTGVRYCPSIEDKVMKFSHHDRHHVFVEPEGYFTDEVYINGLFTSLPPDVQEKMIAAIPGFEAVRFIRYGYAVEYDYCPPTQLKPTLETKAISGLYFAGQINGTTGYEEAAGQGLVAGINAALALREQEPFLLRRDDSYIGVMIDDLVTKGVDEPYRLLTSRAEHRMYLRWDNADLRLMDYGHRFGLIDAADYNAFSAYRERVNEALASPKSLGSPMKAFVSQPSVMLRSDVRDEGSASIQQPEILHFVQDDNNDPLTALDVTQGSWSAVHEAYQIWVQHKYAGYLSRQMGEIARFQKAESKKLPDDFDFRKVPGLLLEAREKLSRIRPVSLGQASRIPGVTPADISILMVFLKKEQGAFRG